MRFEKLKTPTIDIICISYVILFVYAASSKLVDFGKFSADLGKSPLLTAFAPIVAVAVPLVEIIISLFLINASTRLFGLYAATWLMMTFTLYIEAVLQFADFVPCSCGGILQHMSWTTHVIFNIGFVILGIVGIIIYPNQKKQLTT